jgi:DNA polymerase-3 subunit epsilon
MNRQSEPVSPASFEVAPFEPKTLKKLRVLVEAARFRLAGLEAAYTIEKAKVDGVQARLFSRLRPYHQERERLRLIVGHRRQFMETLVRGSKEEAERVNQEYQEAKAQSDRDYEETAAAMAAKKELTGEEEAELGKLWKSLVKLYHPDRFAHEPEKIETYGKLTAAINRAKDNGDLNTLRQIASDPHGFIMRQGWASLDFGDEKQESRLRKLLEMLEKEIASVIDSTNRLRKSPEFELYAMIEKKPEMFDAVVSKQIDQLKAENANLKREAQRLGEEIETLTAQMPPGRF